MVVFVSYARRDAQVADLLRQDIERAKRPVWIDNELTGGQEWWETILSQIRGCSCSARPEPGVVARRLAWPNCTTRWRSDAHCCP
jgi:hypothetical protein